MVRENVRGIFDAIRGDNLKQFATLIVSNSDLNLCFGRFPMLSLLYLFKSYKILNRYEKLMLPISNFKYVEEFGECYVEFKKRAGKIIRFYKIDSVVYPAEMLAILEDNETLAKNYKKIYKNVEIIENINKIYNFKSKFSLIEATETSFVSKRNQVSLKQKFVMSIALVLLCFMIAFPVFGIVYLKTTSGLGTKSSPILIKTQVSLEKALSGDRYYKLLNNIALDKEINTDKFSGTLDGNGYTITFSANQSMEFIDELVGTIKNLRFEIISDKLEIYENSAILVNISSGMIQNCEISGNLEIEFLGTGDLNFAFFVYNNKGTLTGLTANVAAVAINPSGQNSTLASFCSTNNGMISDCKTAVSHIETDTVDTAGLVVENYGEIVNCSNYLDISQTTEAEWHPYVAGITLFNYGTISETENHGSLEASILSVDEVEHEVYVAGIACISVNNIASAKNYGSLSASAESLSTIYVGGIVAYNAIADTTISDISNSYSNCNINIFTSKTASVFAGGLCGVSGTNVNNSGANSIISIDVVGDYYVGGLIGENYLSSFGGFLTEVKNCYSVVKFILNDTETESQSIACAGGIMGCYVRSMMYGVYVNNCYYVKDESFSYPMWISLLGVLSAGTDGDGYVMSFDSFEELKNNASGVNFYE